MRFGLVLSVVCGMSAASAAFGQSGVHMKNAAPDFSMERQGLTTISTSQDAALATWISGFKTRAAREGISNATLTRAFRDVSYNETVISRDRHQSEFTKQIWDYLDSAASASRVRNGTASLGQHAATLDKIEARYGVDKHVVTAIWGLESAYGTSRGSMPVIESLATLAFDGRRGAFFEEQLIAALQIIQSGDTDVSNMKGSWAGAMGHTQFIPTSFLSFAVDGTGDGKRDIWSDDPTDALASTAAYLANHGWNKGQPWGVEVRLPADFDYSLARRDTMRSPANWASAGVRGVDGKPVPNYGDGSILLPAGASGAAFMIFENFAVIERYNKADAYVIGVGHLSDLLRGGDPIQAQWPRASKPLSFDDKQDLQRILRRRGFLDDKVDGLIGPNTINAIREFQRSINVTADGFPSQELLGLLR